MSTISRMLYKHGPSILTVGGIAGFAWTAYLTAKKTPQAVKQLADANIDEDESRPKVAIQQAAAMAPAYSVPIGLFLLSSSLVLLSRSVSGHKYAVAASVATASREALHALRDAMDVTLTPGLKEQVDQRIAIQAIGTTEVPDMPEGDNVLCFDVISGRYFTIDSMETFRKAINDINEIMFSDMFVSLNELYYRIGLPNVKYGDNIGWNVSDGAIEPRYSSILVKDGSKAAVTIDFADVPSFY